MGTADDQRLELGWRRGVAEQLMDGCGRLMARRPSERFGVFCEQINRLKFT
jgi:hypothetical protein